jgi:preprotein translocase subunit SecG
MMSESVLSNARLRGILVRALIILLAYFLVIGIILPSFSRETPSTPGPTPTVGVPATR